MSKKDNKVGKKATTLEGREQQIAAAAVSLAEQKILDGTASPAIIVHYLKIASPEYQLKCKVEEAKLRNLNAKTEMYESTKKIEEMYGEAMAAMREYGGQGFDDEYEE